MDYNDVPAFLRVVETQSFTRAAEQLGTQKSSISRSIKRLESELGVRLLQRTTRQLSLTDAGQAFYERARGLLTTLDEAASSVRELGAKPSGPIRITVPTDASMFGLTEALNSFIRKYPAVQIEVVLSGRVLDLVSEGFDLALRVGELMDSSLVARRVGSTDMGLFAASRYLKRRGRPKKLAELAQHECLLFRGRAGKAVWSFHGPHGEESVAVTGAINADQLSFILRACEMGAGIALLPPTLAREAERRDGIEPVLTDYVQPGKSLHVVLPSARFVPRRVALLRDHLVTELQRAADEVNSQCAVHRARTRVVTPR